MSTQAQIDADAALARRLQEEEFASQVPHMDWAPAPPSPPARSRAHQQPTYPQPTNEWPQPSQPSPSPSPSPSSSDSRFPFVAPRTSFGAAEVLSDLFRHISQAPPPRRPSSTHPTAGLADLGDFPGRSYLQRDDYRRRAARDGASQRAQRNAGASADSMLNSILHETFGRFDGAPPIFEGGGGGASFMVAPEGVHVEQVRTPGGSRVTFAHARGSRTRAGGGSDGGDGAAAAGASAAGAGGGGGGGGAPAHAHRVQFGDAGEMMNLLFSGTFGPFTAMHGDAQNATFGEWFRSMMPGAMEGGETYEDWINVIERMGGNVNRGGTESEIERLPTHQFETEESKDGDTDGAEKCAICLGEYEKGDAIKVLPCAHRFHSECVDQWLRVNRTCPFCKQSIRESDGGGGGGGGRGGGGGGSSRGRSGPSSRRL